MTPANSGVAHPVATNGGHPITWGDIQTFLTPGDGAFLQAWLAILIIVPVVVIALVYREAREKSWAANWQRAFGGSAQSQDGDAAQWISDKGSLHEVCDAIATVPERIAEAMPGLLLIFGLLGTFLGLGLALDQAAGVIQSTAADPAGADTMPELYGVIGKIGAKFKTSTWGLIGFLVFRCWLIATAFDEKRFDWCADRVRVLQTRRQQARVSTELRDQRVAVQTLEQTAAIAASMHGMHSALDRFLTANDENIQAMTRSSAGMLAAAEKMGSSAASLSGAVEGFDRNVASTLGQIKSDLTETIQSMKSSFDSSLAAMSQDLNQATTTIANSVTSLSNAVMTTMTSVKESIEQSVATQSLAHQAFQVSSETLDDNVQAMSNMVTTMCNDIKLGLKAVSDSRQLVASLNGRYQDITDHSAKSAEAIDRLVRKLESVLAILQQMLDSFDGRSRGSTDAAAQEAARPTDRRHPEAKAAASKPTHNLSMTYGLYPGSGTAPNPQSGDSPA